MRRIDAHIHYAGDHPDCLEFLERMELKLLNVCVAEDAKGSWRQQAQVFHRLSQEFPDRYAWCTSFDPPGFVEPDYAERVVASLERDFGAGACACKIWKNIGMAIQKPNGEFLLPDDPVFDPVYRYLEDRGKTLLMHIAEPVACWQPLREGYPHNGYYRRHPEWYMYDKPDHPSHQALIASRDRVLAQYPKLKAVGAHLGSLEHDVDEVAQRLERYPNFAVDTSARLSNLARQDRDKVRSFFLKYQDRILFGTDVVRMEPQSALADSLRLEGLAALQTTYERELAYFESTRQVLIGGRECQGLGLPPAVLEKLFRTNALAWYPGI